MNTIDKDKIYEDYSSKIKSYVNGKVHNYHDAEDLVNNIFLKIYNNINSFDEKKGSLSTWIYMITRNTVIDWFRTNKEHLPLLEEMFAVDIIGNIITDKSPDDLADALEELEEREKDLIILHYYSGYKLKQIGEMMGMSYITAKVIHKKAIAKLRKMMCRKNE